MLIYIINSISYMTQLNIRVPDDLKKKLKVGAVKEDMTLEEYVCNLLRRVA